MTKRWSRLVLAVTLALVLPVLAYFGYSEWDMHRLRTMCSEIRPGATLDDARGIVTRAGLGKYLRNAEGASVPGIFDPSSGTWEIAIPAPTTIGDLVCIITHDGKTVRKVEVYGP